MNDACDGGQSHISMERLKQLVENINAKFAALQRRAQEDASTQQTNIASHESGRANTPCDSKVQKLSSREGNAFSGVANDTSQKVSPKTPRVSHSSPERELYFAASDLAYYLNGGINYRNMCLQYHRALELVVALLREDLAMVSAVDIMPAGTLKNAFTVFTDLFKEAKGFLKGDGEAPKLHRKGNTVKSADAMENGRKMKSSSHVRKSHSISTESNNELPRGRKSLFNWECSPSATKNNASNQNQEGERYLPLRLNHSSAKATHDDSYDVITPKIKEGTEDATFHPMSNSLTKSEMNGFIPKRNETNSSTCYTFLESFNNTLRRYDGIDLLTALTKLVFLKEYEASGTKTADEAFADYKQELEERYFPIIRNYETLREELNQHASLSCEYVVNCMQSHVKPSTRLLSLLDGIDLVHTVTSFSLTNMKLGDDVIQPFIPLLSRMDVIRILDLSYNTLGDGAVCKLCDSLRNHPTLEAIDLSGNNITDAGGAALVELSASTKSLKVIGQHGIQFSPSVFNALSAQLRENRDVGNPSFIHSLVFKRAIGVNRMDERVQCGVPRLAPISQVKMSDMLVDPSSLCYNSESARSEKVINPSMGLSQCVRLPYVMAGRSGGVATKSKS